MICLPHFRVIFLPKKIQKKTTAGRTARAPKVSKPDKPEAQASFGDSFLSSHVRSELLEHARQSPWLESLREEEREELDADLREAVELLPENQAVQVLDLVPSHAEIVLHLLLLKHDLEQDKLSEQYYRKVAHQAIQEILQETKELTLNKDLESHALKNIQALFNHLRL